MLMAFKLGGQLDRVTSLVAFSYIEYFVPCAFCQCCLKINFTYLLTYYLSAMISSQSVPLLAILASSLTLTCLSLIKSTLYPNLVIFISETSVEFVEFFLVLQPHLLQIHLSPANLTTAIHYTLASHKQISTYNKLQ